MLIVRLAFCLLLAAAGAVAQAPMDEIPSLVEGSQAAYLKGDYEVARQSLLKAWDLAQQKPAEDPIRYDVLKRLTAVRSAAGEFADADNFLQLAINWRETVIGRDDPKIADDLLVSVGLSRGLKNYQRALATLRAVMAIHRRVYGEESVPLADDYSRMAQIYMGLDTPSAISVLESGLKIRQKVAGVLDASLLPDLDRLATANNVERRYDAAEETYRHALVIRETLVGKSDADLLSTVEGLAYACFGQKKYDEAEQLYKRLIDLWNATLGGDHPMVALALDKMAVLYNEQKKYDQGAAVTDQAIAIRAAFLAHGLSAAATEQIAEDHQDKALAYYKRALVTMDPTAPIYDELRAAVAKIVSDMEPPPPPPAPPKRPAAKKK